MEGYDKKRLKLLHVYEEVLSSIIFVTETASYYQQNPRMIFKRSTDMKKLLEDWKIIDKESFEHQMNWLINKGTRYFYDGINRRLECMNHEERERYYDSFHDDLVRTRELEIVKDYLYRLPFGIIAYDISWAAYLIGAGYVMKYINEVEHIEYLEKLLELVQYYNMDREVYINSFVVGTNFNTIHVKPEQSWRTHPNGIVSNNYVLYSRLIASKQSPFRRIGM